jgi:hypothetical protein
VKFFKITYQEENSTKIFYIKSVWKIDSLKNLLGLEGKIVCELTVTNCYSFWTRDGIKLIKSNIVIIIIMFIMIFFYISLLILKKLHWAI